MKNYILYTLIVFSFFSIKGVAQNDNPAGIKKHPIALYLGVGPNYYFNNLEIDRNRVQPLNYSLVARLMWEPGQFISLGLESGYYQLYQVNYSKEPFGSVQLTNAAVPIQLVVSIKFLKNYYVGLSAGQSNILSKFRSSGAGSFESSAWSLADFGISAGYKYLLKSRISLGAELKYFQSAKYNDMNLAFVFMAGYRF